MRGRPQAGLCRMEQIVSYCSLLPSHGCSLPSDCINISDSCEAARLPHRPAALSTPAVTPNPATPIPGPGCQQGWDEAGAYSCGHAPPHALLLQIGGGQNINANVLGVAVGVIEESRQLRLQPFNEYRKRFGLKPYTSFQELTGRAPLPQLGSGAAARPVLRPLGFSRCRRGGQGSRAGGAVWRHRRSGVLSRIAA